MEGRCDIVLKRVISSGFPYGRRSIPNLGIKRSQLGNITFPTREYIISLRLLRLSRQGDHQ
jgi:hypothetical protein